MNSPEDISKPDHLRVGRVVTSEVTSEDLKGQFERELRLRQHLDDSWALHEIVSNWSQQQSSERVLRGVIAGSLLLLFTLESLCAFGVLVCIGIGRLTFSQWVAEVFFVLVFTQVASCLTIVIKYLFPGNGAAASLPLELLRVRAGGQIGVKTDGKLS